SKPFDVEEVSARIDSLLRRYKRAIEAPKRNQVVHKDIQLDLDAKMVVVNGISLTLTVREYTILVLLMTSPNKVFSKFNIFESVLHEPFHVDDKTVNVHISNLRNKHPTANQNEEDIETISGREYSL